MHRLENVISSSHYDQLVNTVYTDQPIELWLGILLYEDHNTQIQAAPEQVVVVQYDQPEAEGIFEGEDTEVQMIQDDRLVEGNEVLYKAPENEWQLEKGARIMVAGRRFK